MFVAAGLRRGSLSCRSIPTSALHDPVSDLVVTSPESPIRSAPVSRTVRQLIAPIGLFVLIGIPLVAWLWDTLNRLFAGDFNLARVAIAVAAAVLLVLLLRVIRRTIARWDAAART
jgi:hypothetical protein